MIDFKKLKNISPQPLVITAVLVFVLLLIFLVYFSRSRLAAPWFNIFDKNRHQAEQAVNNETISANLASQLLKEKDQNRLDFFLNQKKFQFKLVNTDPSRVKGLSGRQEIGADGMLFVFTNPGYHGIWMKQMQFDLDLIWFDVSGKIIDLTLSAPAPISNQLNNLPVYQPSEPASMVLEVPAGFVQEYQIQVGQLLEIAD